MFKYRIKTSFAFIRQRFYSDMERVFVRSVPCEERIQISLSYGLEGKKEKTFNFDRDKSEQLSRTLERISTNISKKTITKKNKKKNQDDVGKYPESVSVYLYKEKQVLEGDITNENAWTDGSILQVGETMFQLDINTPSVRSIKLPECMMPGYPVHPTIDAEFIDLNKCEFKWYKFTTPSNEIEPDNNTSCEWKYLTNTLTYTPDNTDVGCKLKLMCVPSDGVKCGKESECVAKNEVSASPGLCPFEERHILTERLISNNRIRLVSYNILADIYSDSDFSRNILFPHCPPYALSMDYRKLLILKELCGYNADIICLQEVDRKIFIHDLQPQLEENGFVGLQKEKSEDVREGTATFYHKSKFRLIEQHDIKLTEELQNSPKHVDLWETISENELLKTQLEERSTILQVCVLESVHDPNKNIIVGTTHLFFRPTASNVRIIQTYICLHHLQNLKNLYTEQGKEAMVIFSGDLNSSPTSGSIDLITTQTVLPSHKDWMSGGEEYKINAPELSHTLNLTSACGFPQYTNYVTRFHECLDYIFIESDQMEVDRVIPLPSHEQVTRYEALPNPVFPSDHLALVCDVSYKDSL